MDDNTCERCHGVIDFRWGSGPCTCSLFEKVFDWFSYNKKENEN